MENNTIITNLTKKEDAMFISFQPESVDDKKLLYEATTNGTPLKDVVNKKIMLMDVIVTSAEVKNDNEVDSEGNPTTSTVPRVSIITTEGEIYLASSWGIYNCLSRINSIFGTLHFDEGLAVIPYQVKTKNGFTMNLKLA